MKLEVKRSARRRKTVQARLIDGVLKVAIPADMSESEEQHWVEVMRGKFERRTKTDVIDLAARAQRLIGRHGLSRPSQIGWSERQKTLWGSCTPGNGHVRIATRLASFPDWVLDYVIVHELAHLDQAGHGKAFWEIVERYPLAERARGYLIAKGDSP